MAELRRWLIERDPSIANLLARFQQRLSLGDAPRRQRMNRLNWEINNRAKRDEGVARRSPRAARQPLSDEEVEAKRGELQQLARWLFASAACSSAVVLAAAVRGRSVPPRGIVRAASGAG